MSFRMQEAASAAPMSRAERRRAEILDAAYRVFADRGFAEATIADIAKELSIGHGTFYRYFENKQDIFDHVVDLVVARISAALADERPDASDGLEEYRAQVRRIAGNLLVLLDEDPRAAKLLFVEAWGVSDALDARLREMWRLFGQVTGAYLENGRTRGFLRADLDVEITALAINAMIFEGGRQVVLSERDAGDGAAARARWIDAVTAMMFDGVRSAG